MRRPNFAPGDLSPGRRRAGRNLRAPAALVAVSGLAAWGWLAIGQDSSPAAVDHAAPSVNTVALIDAELAPLPQPDAAPAVTPPEQGQAALPAGPVRLASVDPEASLSTSSIGPQPSPLLVKPETPAPISAVPIPAPRPAELRAPVTAERPEGEPQPAQPSPGQTQKPGQTASLPTTPAPAEDNRSFFDKLFGIRPGASPQAGVAIYDISARTVTLPNGERLEAHSGYGDKLDDPRYVNVPMRGATPPGTYDLKEREKLFHGVRAIRLTPVGGEGTIYNRVGLLAHTFMLGARGDSNGCVSFRNYDKFLQAYLRGEIQRMVVVTGRGDSPPAIAGQGGTRRASLRGRDA